MSVRPSYMCRSDPANIGASDADEHICWFFNFRVGNIFYLHLSGAFINECLLNFL